MSRNPIGNSPFLLASSKAYLIKLGANLRNPDLLSVRIKLVLDVQKLSK